MCPAKVFHNGVDMGTNDNHGMAQMFTSVSSRAASAYKRVGAETSVSEADPHQLIQLLFDALRQSLSLAKSCLAQGDIPGKGAAIVKAVRLIEEGLRAGLDPEKGGAMAQDLDAIYTFCVVQLTMANLKNDVKLIDEVANIIEPVALGWSELRSKLKGS